MIFKEIVFKALDKAVNAVISNHFDLYFDKSEVDALMIEWLKTRLQKVEGK